MSLLICQKITHLRVVVPQRACGDASNKVQILLPVHIVVEPAPAAPVDGNGVPAIGNLNLGVEIIN